VPSIDEMRFKAVDLWIVFAVNVIAIRVGKCESAIVFDTTGGQDGHLFDIHTIERFDRIRGEFLDCCIHGLDTVRFAPIDWKLENRQKKWSESPN
jgi:hypothetical protein